MTTIAEYVATAPAASVGHTTGYGDWKVGVQMLLPANADTWNDATWGSSSWGSLEWVDVTDYVRGLEWTRGADEYDGRPRVGYGGLTLDNSDYAFSPIDPTNSFESVVTGASTGINNFYYGPGTVVRVVAVSPTGNYTPEQAAIQADYETWAASWVYALPLDGSLTSIGSTDDLSGTPTYDDLPGVSNWPDIQGMASALSFASTQMDTMGGQLAGSFTLYVPSLSLGADVGLWSNGGGTNWQAMWIETDGTLVLKHSNGGTTDEVSYQLTETGTYTIGYEIGNSVSDTIALYVNGVQVDSASMTVASNNGGGDPQVGNVRGSILGGTSIATDGMVIGHFVQHDTASAYTSTEQAEYHAYMMTPDPDSTWVPQITGVVETWDEVRMAKDVESYVEVTFIETLARLARVDDNARDYVEGDDDTLYERIQRLGDAADWDFGYLDQWSDSEALQSTDMADNRLAEIYLSADSVGAVVRTDRTGAMVIYDKDSAPTRGPVTAPVLVAGDGAYPTHEYSPNTVSASAVCYVDPEELTTQNDAEPIINHVQMARVGSTVQLAYDNASISRFGRVSYSRNDLINKSDATTLALADALVARRKAQTLRLYKVNLHSFTDDNVTGAMLSLDVGNKVPALWQGTTNGGSVLWTNATIDMMEHSITPTSPTGPVLWRTIYTMGVADAPTYYAP